MDRGPVETDLVLLGGGHSHLAVLRSFGMKPVPGVRLTLIAKDVHTPYSGMLPGLVAGFYGFDEAHVDLRPLAAFAGARLYRASGVGLDLERKRVLCDGRPPAPFDYLSINVGSTPRLPNGGADGIVPVKPIGEFVTRWEELLERVRRRGGPVRVAVVGGGPGGVELMFAAHRRLNEVLAAAGGGAGGVECHLFTDTPEILPGLHPRARRLLRNALESRGVRVHAGEAVRGVADGALVRGNGDECPVDEVLWVTEASAAPWLRATGLALTGDGFIRLRDTLQSVSRPDVFAAGDVATMDRHPRDKAGVYAVRQGKPLARNLRRIVEGREPRPFRPQRTHLVLVGTADGEAVGVRGPLVWRGGSAWRLKDRIDRRFMRRYGELPEMASGGGGAPVSPRTDRTSAGAPMRCGGCGAKVGGDTLGRVLARLKPVVRDDVLVGLDAPDDAAVTTAPAGKVSVQSVDFFRTFIADPYVFGAVTANHCLNDLFAMGARPRTALAVATAPFGRPSKVEDDLFQMLAGALSILDEAGCALVGGHSGEGAEMALGFAVNGLADPDGVLCKRGARPGDSLVLTKPLGVGALFAADMRGRAKGRWIDEALTVMIRSNAAAAGILRDFGANAVTDVTGFGVAGHLAEMMEGQGVAVELSLDALPLLSGAIDTLEAGFLSTLDPENRHVESRIRRGRTPADDPRYAALFDPQTAGGLLASVPRARADDCLAALTAAGYADVAVIGTVREGDPADGALIAVS